jgi:hypothetical protein
MSVFFFIRPNGFFWFLTQSPHLAEPPNPVDVLLLQQRRFRNTAISGAFHPAIKI